MNISTEDLENHYWNRLIKIINRQITAINEDKYLYEKDKIQLTSPCKLIIKRCESYLKIENYEIKTPYPLKNQSPRIKSENENAKKYSLRRLKRFLEEHLKLIDSDKDLNDASKEKLKSPCIIIINSCDRILNPLYTVNDEFEK